ncbi:MAG TPA: protease SohB [Gammaproteobacteria bacterium]|nr:protease SohB [Gammaproteobacteria bacterium]
MDALFQISIFSAKLLITVVFLLILLIGIISILSRSKEKLRGRITVKNLNQKYRETKEFLSAEILTKNQFKKFNKEQKKADKEKIKSADTNPQKNIFVLNFEGDIKASAVNALREEVTAILGVATIHDEVVVKIESAGGMVHAYGLAASQLMRIREQHIPLTVIVDKIAASGGYLMACVANKILAAPFAIIGSIGVIVQLPNFHRLLKNNHIDFEQITAGQFKRTLTLFGENTIKGREKMHEEIEEIHTLFKNLIKEHRPQIDTQKVATGEHWLGSQALELKLIDSLQTSDDYLYAHAQNAELYEICYYIKKSFAERCGALGRMFIKRRSLEDTYIL